MFIYPFRSYSYSILSHNNIIQIFTEVKFHYRVLQFNCSFCDNLTPLGVTFILLAMVHWFITNQHLSLQLVFCSFCDNLTPLGVTFILLAMVHWFITNQHLSLQLVLFTESLMIKQTLKP